MEELTKQEKIRLKVLKEVSKIYAHRLKRVGNIPNSKDLIVMCKNLENYIKFG